MTEILNLEPISEEKTPGEVPKNHLRLYNQDNFQWIVAEKMRNNSGRCRLTENKEVLSLICFDRKQDLEDKMDDPGKEIKSETKTMESKKDGLGKEIESETNTMESKIDGLGKEIESETRTTEIERDLIKQDLILVPGLLDLLNKGHDTVFKVIETEMTEDQIRYVQICCCCCCCTLL